MTTIVSFYVSSNIRRRGRQEDQIELYVTIINHLLTNPIKHSITMLMMVASNHLCSYWHGWKGAFEQVRWYVRWRTTAPRSLASSPPRWYGARWCPSCINAPHSKQNDIRSCFCSFGSSKNLIAPKRRLRGSNPKLVKKLKKKHICFYLISKDPWLNIYWE